MTKNTIANRTILGVTILVMIMSLMAIPNLSAQALAAGIYDYYIPASSRQIMDIFIANDNNPVINESDGLHYVIALTAYLDDTVIYYDHWENGYSFNPVTFTGADEIYTGDHGQVMNFVSSSVPANRLVAPNEPINACGTSSSNPDGPTTNCYDGRDHVFVTGGMAASLTIWPEVIGTVYALSWALYPTKPFQTSYTIPVGRNLTGYNDFSNTYVIVQSTADGTQVTINDPQYSGVEVSVTLNKGEVTQLHNIWSGTVVSANHPVQTQYIAGETLASGSCCELRGFTAIPTSLWSNEYFDPVSGRTGGNGTELYIYNPGSAQTVNWQDLSGSGSFAIGAGATLAYSDTAGANHKVPNDSGVRLTATNDIYVIGSADTEAGSYEWGFNLLPSNMLVNEYYLGWAPGNSAAIPSNNCSPVWITATQNNTSVSVDYSPGDGIYEATYVLDQLEAVRIYDPDFDNTGMDLVANGPFAAAWGEAGLDQSGTSCGAGNINMDLGYTMVPYLDQFVDVVLNLDNTADPTLILNQAGQISEFTLTVSTDAFAVDNVDVVDILPVNWAYVDNSAIITFPDDTIVTGNSADPTSIAGMTLTWNLNVDMPVHETLTIVFEAVTTAAPGGTSINKASATGRLDGHNFTAMANTTVNISDIQVEKESNVTGLVEPGDIINYTVNLTNISLFPHYAVALRDLLPTGTSYIAHTTTANGYLLGTYLDQFGTQSYGNSNGTFTWSSSWIEGLAESGNNPANGLIQITGGKLQFRDTGAPRDYSLTRAANLSGRTKAVLSFTYEETGTLENADTFHVDVYDGASWHTVLTKNDDFGGPLDVSYDITAWANANTQIRIVANGYGDTGEILSFDNFSIQFDQPVIKDNIAGGTYPDLVNGVPENLAVTGDAFVLPAGRMMTITYQVQVNNPLPFGLMGINNEAYASIAEDPRESKGSVMDPLDVIDVSLDKEISDATPEIGSLVTFTLHIANPAGFQAANNLVITDIVPNGYTYGTGSISGGTNRNDSSPAGTGLTWTIASLVAGGSVDLTYQATVLDSGTYDNYAEITAYSQYDINSRAGNGQQTPDENDDDTVEVIVFHSPALNVTTKTDVSEVDSVGDVIHYTLEVENVGNINLTGVTVNDPEIVYTYISGDLDSDGVLDVTETWIYTGSYTVNQDELDAGGTIQTEVTADSNESPQDSYVSVVAIIQNPDMLVTMTADVSGVYLAGEVITYTVTVENNGNVTLTDVTTEDDPDISLSYLSGDTDSDGELDVDEIWVYTGSYTVTQDDIDAGIPIHTEVTVWNDQGDSETGQEDVLVNNTAPQSTGDGYSMHWSAASLVVDMANGVLVNDSDLDLDPLTAVMLTDVSHGILTLATDGSFNYNPTPGFHGPSDSFTYRAYDGNAYSEPATVTISFTNTLPDGAADEYNTTLGTALVVDVLHGLISNDNDLDGDPLEVALITGPAADEGTLSLEVDGSFVFTPAASFVGDATFTYRLFDGLAYGNPVTVTIHVSAARYFMPFIIKPQALSHMLYFPILLKYYQNTSDLFLPLIIR